MRINEAMKETGLTKKAIYYYENEGLIKPQKDPDNNYRNYTENDVRTLITINILRRFDIPIKTIGDIIRNSVPMKDILKEQLVQTNRKINSLYQNKMVMNDLIMRDISEKDFTFDTLREFNQNLDQYQVLSGYVGRELEKIFPGTLGKTFAIFYSNFLDVPLDTDEKVSAWNELIKRLDEMNEIDFPEDIKKVVDELYSDITDEKLAHWEKLSRQVVADVLGKDPSQPDPEKVTMAKEALEEYYANPENQKKIEGFYRLQSFILNNLDMFREIDHYIAMIDEKYGRYMDRINMERTRPEQINMDRIAQLQPKGKD
jgi:Predicted transcriptional regulators